MITEEIVFDRAHYDRSWFDQPLQLRKRWCAWVIHHGINPNTVIVPGWIERRPAARQIAYLTAMFDADGRPRIREDRLDLLTEVRVVQLEAVPSPFPDGDPS